MYLKSSLICCRRCENDLEQMWRLCNAINSHVEFNFNNDNYISNLYVAVVTINAEWLMHCYSDSSRVNMHNEFYFISVFRLIFTTVSSTHKNLHNWSVRSSLCSSWIDWYYYCIQSSHISQSEFGYFGCILSWYWVRRVWQQTNVLKNFMRFIHYFELVPLFHHATEFLLSQFHNNSLAISQLDKPYDVQLTINFCHMHSSWCWSHVRIIRHANHKS